jgi:predicted ferric reductase
MTTLSPNDTERTTAYAAPADIQRQLIADDDISSVVGVALPVLMSLLALVLMLGGAMVLAIMVPNVGASLNTALLGAKTFWYLTRASAFVAYGLLWWSMASGLAITNRMARAWPGGPTVSNLHEYASILGLAFGTIHALSLLGDHYIGYSLTQILVPFSNAAYQPFWVGLGQVAFYLMIPVTFSFYLRRWIGGRAWRVIHYLSFATFALALAHGIWSGSDSGATWAQWAYLASGISLVVLTIFRIQVSRKPGRRVVA